MNENRRKKSSNGTVGIAIVAVLALLQLINLESAVGFLMVVIFIGIIGFIVGFALLKKKGGAKAGSVYHAERGKEMQKLRYNRDNMDEEAVKCAHPRGREKYIHQLDNFLSNGLIDKTEYRMLKERYQKMSIPDDFC